MHEWFTLNKALQQQRSGGGGSNPSSLSSSPANNASAAESLAALLASKPSDQEPWRSATTPEAAKDAILKALASSPALRVTGKVVAVLEPSPKRERVVGVIAAVPGASPPAYALLPLDPKLPRMAVAPTDVSGMPDALKAEAAATDVSTRTLMSARVSEWPADSPEPVVSLRGSLGQAGEIETETAAILEMEGVRHEPFSDEVLACLPATPWAVAEQDLKQRRDFR